MELFGTFQPSFLRGYTMVKYTASLLFYFVSFPCVNYMRTRVRYFIFSAVKIVSLFCWAFIRCERSLDNSETLLVPYSVSSLEEMKDFHFIT